MILGMLAAAAVAGAPTLITQPLWKTTPNLIDFIRAYPEKPRLARIGGRAVVQCGVKADGGLEACAVVSEEPIGLGFGEAALKLAGGMVLHPQTRAGVDVAGGVIQIPIRFAAPPAPPEGRPMDSANVILKKRPTGEDLARYYPTQAMQERVEGLAVAVCRITPQFTLTGCVVSKEEPYGYGFGMALQYLTDTYELSPTGKDGAPITPGDIMSVGVQFRMGR
ncbi:TonB family protein [Phenylobacterium sp. 20VBR1]|nr:TonB family protein [Phenylobacterium glaciei]MBR7617873.1 TonB family protein [Phenylobacterium glaciei]